MRKSSSTDDPMIALGEIRNKSRRPLEIYNGKQRTSDSKPSRREVPRAVMLNSYGQREGSR